MICLIYWISCFSLLKYLFGLLINLYFVVVICSCFVVTSLLIYIYILFWLLNVFRRRVRSKDSQRSTGRPRGGVGNNWPPCIRNVGESFGHSTAIIESEWNRKKLLKHFIKNAAKTANPTWARPADSPFSSHSSSWIKYFKFLFAHNKFKENHVLNL